MRNWLYWVWLAEAFGPGFDCRAIIEEYGEPREFFDEGEAVIDEMRRRGLIRLSNEKAERIKDSFSDAALDDAKRILEKAYRLDLGLLTLTDSLYPQKLRNITGAPTLLYIKGVLPKAKEVPMIGVVGSRKCSHHSVNATLKLCKELSLGGATVVSGLAEGIDTAAAKAALSVNRPTVAVVGCGLDRVYPASNKELFSQIVSCGAVVSEYAPGTPPKAMNFPQRNRIISGMSSGIVVVEAGGKSGALITAKDAERQRRDVFVLDMIDDDKSIGDFQGCRVLAARGAVKVSGAKEILEYYSKKEDNAPEQGDEIWDDRYLAWDGDNEPQDFDEPEWVREKEKLRDSSYSGSYDYKGDWNATPPIGVRVMLPESGWPEAPQYAADPRTKKFSRFLKKIKTQRGINGGTVITFEEFNDEMLEQEVAAQEKKRSEMPLIRRIDRVPEKTEEPPAKTEKVIPKEEKAENDFFDVEMDELSDVARKVLKEMSDVPIGMDELSVKLDVRVDKLAAALSELEINGYVVSLPGARYLLP
ncbi:MAG: DNA-processing protein DprA [Oscillospiraceae bacterium]|nr:DNA-processing protein DprA [Oscillospiraceae bacterium]